MLVGKPNDIAWLNAPNGGGTKTELKYMHIVRTSTAMQRNKE